MKEDKRKAELDEFNKRLEVQPADTGLYNQFKKMDEGKKLSGQESELDKRRQIFKNVRKEIDRDEKNQKEIAYREKMASLESKTQLKE